jgi:GntR family transcriptional regulator
VDSRSSTPIAEQLFQQVVFAIAGGVYREGEKLPSVRVLSSRVLVNPNTVAKVYRDLERAGFLKNRRGVGVFVRNGSLEASVRLGQSILSSSMDGVVRQAREAGVSKGDAVKLLRERWKEEP